MKHALLFFCLLDLVFLAIFSFSIVYDFGAHILLIIIAFVAVITYYPLIVLYNETKDESFPKTKMWLVNHVQFCTFYCFTRGVFVLIYFSTIIIEGADLDISYVFAHVHVEVKVFFGLLLGFFVVQVILNTFFIVPHFKSKITQELNKTTVYATINYESRATQKSIFNSLEEVTRGSDRILLVPGDNADLAVTVTQMASTPQ